MLPPSLPETHWHWRWTAELFLHIPTTSSSPPAPFRRHGQGCSEPALDSCHYSVPRHLRQQQRISQACQHPAALPILLCPPQPQRRLRLRRRERRPRTPAPALRFLRQRCRRRRRRCFRLLPLERYRRSCRPARGRRGSARSTAEREPRRVAEKPVLTARPQQAAQEGQIRLGSRPRREGEAPRWLRCKEGRY